MGSRYSPHHHHHQDHDGSYGDTQTALDITYLNVKYDPRFKLSPLLPPSTRIASSSTQQQQPIQLRPSHHLSYDVIDTDGSSLPYYLPTTSSSMYSSQSNNDDDDGRKDGLIINAMAKSMLHNPNNLTSSSIIPPSIIQPIELQQQHHNHHQQHNHPSQHHLHHRNSILSSTLSLPLLTPPAPHGLEPPLIKQVDVMMMVKKNPLQSSASPVRMTNSMLLFQNRFHDDGDNNDDGDGGVNMLPLGRKVSAEQLKAIERKKNERERMKLRKILTQSILS